MRAPKQALEQLAITRRALERQRHVPHQRQILLPVDVHHEADPHRRSVTVVADEVPHALEVRPERPDLDLPEDRGHSELHLPLGAPGSGGHQAFLAGDARHEALQLAAEARLERGLEAHEDEVAD